jgi:hypothetical protein
MATEAAAVTGAGAAATGAATAAGAGAEGFYPSDQGK